MKMAPFWGRLENDERLREAVALKVPASHIAEMLGGIPVGSVVARARTLDLPLIRYSDDELQEQRRKKRERDIRSIKNRNLSQKRKKQSGPARSGATSLPRLAPGQTKGHPAYRNQLPRAPEMTKSELRQLLADAVARTSGAVV